jgi:Zn-dependent peptidase ImmA (M78 family)
MYYLYENGEYEEITDRTLQLNSQKVAISEFAEKIRESFNMTEEELIHELGGKISDNVIFKDSEIDGAIYVYGADNFEIKLSSNSGKPRKKFTLAHELGHYILHTNFGKRVDDFRENKINLKAIVFKRHESNNLEWEANSFAGAFLMPEKEFREKNEKYRDDYMLSAQFDVSVSAVKVRKQVLGIE